MTLVCVLVGCEGFGHVIDKVDAPIDVALPDDVVVDAMDIDAAIDAPPDPIPAGLLFAFDSACPTGFTERMDLANLYLRGHDGDSQYGEIGGAATHTHVVPAHTHAIAAGGAVHNHAVTFGTATLTTNATPGGTLPGTGPTHRHSATSSMGGGPHTHPAMTSSSFATTTAMNDPLLREVVLCEVSGTPTLLPTAAISLASSTCAAGWTPAANTVGRLLRGHDLDAELSEIGGNAMHSHAMGHGHSSLTGTGGDHTHTATAGAASVLVDDLVPGTAKSASSTHGHTVTLSSSGHVHTFPVYAGGTAAASSMPEYREVMMCHAPAPMLLPDDALAMSTGPCPAGWIEATEFRNRFLAGDDGDAMPGEIAGGSHTHDATHTHGSTGMSDHTHTATGGESAGTAAMRDSNSRLVSAIEHTHAMSVTAANMHAHAIDVASPVLTTVDALPRYVEVLVCKRE